MKKLPVNVNTKLNPVMIIFAGVSLLLLLFGITFFGLYLNARKKLENITPAPFIQAPTPDAAQINKIIQQAGKHILLPTGIPQVITVSNVDTLKKSQPFFSQAQNGNKLLIYSNKVIIYDPIGDRIIDVAYIKPSEASKPSPSLTPSSSKKK